MEFNMTDTQKTILILGGALAIFYLLNKVKIGGKTKKELKEERKKVDVPTMNAKDAKGNKQAQDGFICLKAYIDAFNNGEPANVLDELNREFAKEYKLRVFRRSSDNKIVVSDLSGNPILVNG